jgi:hypothetical protein
VSEEESLDLLVQGPLSSTEGIATMGAVEFRIKCIELNILDKFTIFLKYGD